MKHAIVDIGSNSMRLTLYETDEASFRILFKEKIMAGLAGYVENDVLTKEGIGCACAALLEFKETLEALEIENVSVFATASLRNIENTNEAIIAIESATGYQIEVVSGEEEAMYGYYGAMYEHHITNGAIVDIGGASTEIVILENGKPITAVSHGIGSLSLYRECVKKILPGHGSYERLNDEINKNINKKNLHDLNSISKMVCVGGTARAALNIAGKLFSLPENSSVITSQQFKKMCSLLFKADKTAINIILKLEPDRIHTLIPGLMILRQITELLDVNEITVSRYGVREGYLCQKILKSKPKRTRTRKTVS